MKLEKLPGYEDLIPIDEFVEDCDLGCIIDDDGSGYFATDTMMSDILAYPSDICDRESSKKTEKLIEQFTHIAWFGK